jgi:RHS repeat-associated protein
MACRVKRWGASPGRPPLALQLKRVNVWFGGRLIGQVDATLGPMPKSLVLADRVGTNRQWGGYFLPYGEEMTSTGSDRDKFATYQRDSFTGLDYADQRFYASSYGRFTTADAFQPRPSKNSAYGHSSTWNKYAYVTNDPVNLVDPHGTCGTPPISYVAADGAFVDTVSIPCDWDYGFSGGFGGVHAGTPRTAPADPWPVSLVQLRQYANHASGASQTRP